MAGHDPERPTIGVCFYRSHRLTGNTAFIDALCAAIEEAGGNALAVWSYTLRRDADGRVPALELIGDRVDALVVTMLATGGSSAGDAVAAEGGDGVGEAWQEWDASALAGLGVAVIQAVSATSSRAAWEESSSGLAPLDAATQVAIPEFDGRLLGGVISFKERDSWVTRVGTSVARYVPDLERCARVARLAVRTARLRTLPAAERRVAVLLTSFPTKHAKVGMAVGLDTPASALRLFDAMRGDGMRVDAPFEHGDELMHALIATGGHDAEFLTDDQLAASPLRLPGRRLHRLVRGVAGVAARGHRGALGPAAGRPLHRRRRLRRGRARARQRARRDPAAARLRRRSRGDLPRPRAAARRTTTWPATGGSSASGERTRSCISASTARSSGCPARRSRSRPAARPTPRSATCRSSTRSSSTTRARASRPSGACTR